MNSQPHILYVEDDPKSRRVMKLLLVNRMQLPHVTILEDSSDFLEHVQSLEPKVDMVFLDIHVLPLNGFEMLKALRNNEAFKQTPIVALTASVMNEEIAQLKEAGFDGCIAKPIDTDTFPDMIQSIVNGEQLWQVML